MAMKEVGRILKKDGYLVLYIPNILYPLETHGARIGKKYIMGFYGSIPLLSWAPRFIRNRFETARIYSKREILNILERNDFTIQEVDYMYPPLDKLGSEFTKVLLRRLLAYLEGNSFTKKYGMSIFLVAQKKLST